MKTMQPTPASMKSSQLANLYTLRLVSDAMPGEGLETLMIDLLDTGLARGALELLKGCLRSLDYEPRAIRQESAKVARKALKQPDPMAYVLERAASDPLALSDEEAALRTWGLDVDKARALSVKPQGIVAARAISEGSYEDASKAMARV